jgi:AraC-like DNA-binding protein
MLHTNTFPLHDNRLARDMPHPSPTTPFNPDVAAAPVIGLAEDFPPGQTPLHHHQRAQLVYAVKGALRVCTRRGYWVVPPMQAVWVPAQMPHQVSGRRPFALRTLYFAVDFLVHSPFREMACQLGVVTIPPLVRELILKLCEVGPEAPFTPLIARKVDVLLDELAICKRQALEIIWPQERLAKRLADYWQADLADKTPLTRLAQHIGGSPRTLTRRFQQETGLSPAQWRLQLRLLYALEALAENHPITSIALDLGYESLSAFGEIFKRHFGTSPRGYFPNSS